ncbi:hypothetical protein IWX47DRAFT_388077 [Phyllosticta citricarpa]
MAWLAKSTTRMVKTTRHFHPCSHHHVRAMSYIVNHSLREYVQRMLFTLMLDFIALHSHMYPILAFSSHPQKQQNHLPIISFLPTRLYVYIVWREAFLPSIPSPNCHFTNQPQSNRVQSSSPTSPHQLQPPIQPPNPLAGRPPLHPSIYPSNLTFQAGTRDHQPTEAKAQAKPLPLVSEENDTAVSRFAPVSPFPLSFSPLPLSLSLSFGFDYLSLTSACILFQQINQ